MRFLPTDSRGKESTTLAFVAATWLAETSVFVLRGTAADIISYGTATGATLLIWLGREWTEKHAPKQPQGGS